jgi:hypothetical protein
MRRPPRASRAASPRPFDLPLEPPESPQPRCSRAPGDGEGSVGLWTRFGVASSSGDSVAVMVTSGCRAHDPARSSAFTQAHAEMDWILSALAIISVFLDEAAVAAQVTPADPAYCDFWTGEWFQVMDGQVANEPRSPSGVPSSGRWVR